MFLLTVMPIKHFPGSGEMSTGFSSKGFKFNSQHPHSSLYLFVIPVPGNPNLFWPLRVLYGSGTDIYAGKQVNLEKKKKSTTVASSG